MLRGMENTEAMGANKFDGFSTEDMETEITRRKKASVSDLIEEELVAEVGRLHTLVASAEERLSDYRISRLPYKVDEVIEVNTSGHWEKAIVRRVTSTGMYYASTMRKNGQWSLGTQFVVGRQIRKAASGG